MLGIGLGRNLDLADHPVDHELEQILLARDVRVERCRAGAELLGDAPHRHRVEPLAVDDLERGSRDRLAREAALARRTAA